MTTGKAKKTGRPTKRTAKVVERIITLLADGIPMTEICEPDDMPTPRAVRRWAVDDKELSSAIARARALGFDTLADECLDIADNASNDWMARKDKDGEESWQFNGEHVQRSKLRIETRLKLLAKWDPKRYGELVKLEHGGAGGGPIEVTFKRQDAASG